MPDGRHRVRPEWALADGYLLGAPQISLDPPEDGRTPVAIWDPAGGISVVAWLENPYPRMAFVRMHFGMLFPIPQPLPADPIIGAVADGAWFFALERTPAETERRGEIMIHRFTAAGASLGTIVIPYAPVGVTDSVRARRMENAMSMMEHLATVTPHLGIDMREVERAIRMPDYHPPVYEALADEDGFWLSRWETPPRSWERYDLNGRLLARVEQTREVFDVLGASANALIVSLPLGRGNARVRKLEFTLVPATAASDSAVPPRPPHR